jgi:hypothetical protein
MTRRHRLIHAVLSLVGAALLGAMLSGCGSTPA